MSLPTPFTYVFLSFWFYAAVTSASSFTCLPSGSLFMYVSLLFPFFTFVSLPCLRMCPFFFYVSPFCFPFYVCLPSGSLFTYVSLLVGLFHRCPFWLPFLPMYPFCSSFYVCVPYFLLLHMCPLCFLFFKRVPSVSLLTCGSAKLKIILSCQFTSRAL